LAIRKHTKVRCASMGRRTQERIGERVYEIEREYAFGVQRISPHKLDSLVDHARVPRAIVRFVPVARRLACHQPLQWAPRERSARWTDAKRLFGGIDHA